jgi:hypothetical protein
VPDPQSSPEQVTGWLPEGQRDTAPLTRDNSRVNGPASSSASSQPSPAAEGPGGTTRPAFVQPRPPAAPAGYAATPQPYGYYATNSQPTPPAQQPRPATARGPITPLGWVARGSILLAISLVSGLIWHAILHSSDKPTTAQPPAQPRTQYQFAPVGSSDGGQNCKQVSTGKIAAFFAQHPCDHLTRALYSTTLPGGQQVLTSVVTVRMPDAASAGALNALDTKDDTGNIQPLPNPPGSNLPKLNYNYTYASQQQNQLVVIAESLYFGKSTSPEDPTLLSVTRDALQLGWPQDSAPK